MTNEELAVAIQGGQAELYSDLWAGVVKFVTQQAGRWNRAWQGRGGVELDDFLQDGFLALVDAVKDYDPAKGSFLTWYSMFLKKAFAELVGCRRRETLNDSFSLDAPAGGDDTFTLGDTLAGGDCIADADRRIYLEQLHAALEAALEALPPEQADTLRRRFFGGLTRQEISEADGVAVREVMRRERQGLNALMKPAAARTLSQFLDNHTDFYRVHGVHGVESAVIHREWLTETMPDL